MGGQKRRTISALRKRASQEKAKDKPSERRRARVRGLQPMKELEGIAKELASDRRYITPYMLSNRADIKLSRSREVLRKLSGKGLLGLVEKNGDVEIYTLAQTG